MRKLLMTFAAQIERSLCRMAYSDGSEWLQ